MLITPEEVEALRTEEKDCVLDAVLGMAWSDGTIQDEEREVLTGLTRHLTDKPLDDLLNEYKVDQARVSRKIAQSDLGSAGKKLLLRAMAYVAAADESVDEKELAFYRGCQRSFGLHERLRERLEEDVNREVYAEQLKRRLSKGEAADAAREALSAMRKRLNIDDAAAADIEARVRKFLKPG